MEVIAVVLAAILAVAVVVFVARPFLREPEASDDALAELTDDQKARLRLIEERDRALAALKELEFDHRTGKISDEDYEVQVSLVRREAAAAIQALDEFDGQGSRVEPRSPRETAQPEATSTHSSQASGDRD